MSVIAYHFSSSELVFDVCTWICSTRQPPPRYRHLWSNMSPSVVRIPSLTQRGSRPFLTCSAVITTTKYSSETWVRKKKTRSTQVPSTPSGIAIKLWFIPVQTAYKKQGSCFRARFFIFLQGRGRVARVAVRWQIKWGNGSRLGGAVQTAARQAEWAVECLSSCRVHSTQWKATHLVTGLLGRAVPALMLGSRCNRVTKTEGVRHLCSQLYPSSTKQGCLHKPFCARPLAYHSYIVWSHNLAHEGRA